MAEYRFLFCDSLTGVLQEELPLACQSFSQQINGAGSLTGTLALGELATDVRWRYVDWRSATIPKRTLLIVQRDDQIVWGGRIMKRRPVGGGASAEVTAETLEAYLARQEIQTDLTYTGVDVFTIVRAILNWHQGTLGGDMRLDMGVNTAGQVATVAYLGKDSAKILDAVNKLAEVSPGFEYTITWTRTGAVFTPTLTLAAPGLNVGVGPIVLEYPGNVINYEYPEDGTASPNLLTGVGADSGGTPLLTRVADSGGELASGYPVYHGQIALKYETDATRLAALTGTALAAGLVDYVVPTVDLRGDADPHFGDFPLGCQARLRATSLYHPVGNNGAPGLDVTRRVTGWTVTPGPNEKVSLALASTTGKITPPVRYRNVNAYLADLARRLRALETA